MEDIHNILFRVIAHATESEDRVKTALSLFIFDNEIETNTTEGYFGNPIIIMQSHLKRKNCNSFVTLLRSKMPEEELRKIKSELPDRIDDECVLHIRFDKQAAYQGQVRLAANSDTIMAQLKLRAYPANREKAVAAAEKLF